MAVPECDSAADSRGWNLPVSKGKNMIGLFTLVKALGNSDSHQPCLWGSHVLIEAVRDR